MNVFQRSQSALLAVALLGVVLVSSKPQGNYEATGAEGGDFAEREELRRPRPNDPLANAFGGLGGAFGGIFGAKKEAPPVVGGAVGPASTGAVSGGPSTNVIVVEEKKGDDELISLEKLGEWAKLIFSPFELIKAIGDHFKVPFEKLVEAIGGSVVFGTEALMQPVVISMQVFEDVFVPDQCVLKTVCKVGEHLTIFRDGVSRFSPHFLEESNHIQALAEGIQGHDCEVKYDKCGSGEPKLRKPIEELRLKDLEEISGSKDYRASSGSSEPGLGIFGFGKPKKN